MVDDEEIDNRKEHELSMDEILSSIRGIITQDLEAKTVNRLTSFQKSSANSYSYRVMEELPEFDPLEDDFQLSYFTQDIKVKTSLKEQDQKAFLSDMYPDGDLQLRYQNGSSLKGEAETYGPQEKVASETQSTEDRVLKALKGIVASYGQGNSYSKEDESIYSTYRQQQASSGLTEVINKMIEKLVVVIVEEWLHTNLSRILEQSILRELEHIASKTRF